MRKKKKRILDCHIMQVPYKVSTMHSGDFGNEMMPAENIYGNDDEDPYCLPPTEEEELYGVGKMIIV
ncbi:hypothetical protein EMCRGX_G016932 [Ephydatia muelleri]